MCKIGIMLGAAGEKSFFGYFIYELQQIGEEHP